MNAIDHLKTLIREDLEAFLESYATGTTILSEDCNLISFEASEIPAHAVERTRALFKDVAFFVNGLSEDGVTLCVEEPKDPLLAYIHQALLHRRTVRNLEYRPPNTTLLAAGLQRHCDDYIPFQLIRNDVPGYQEIYSALIALLKALSNIFAFGIRLDDEHTLTTSDSGAIPQEVLGYL